MENCDDNFDAMDNNDGGDDGVMDVEDNAQQLSPDEEDGEGDEYDGEEDGSNVNGQDDDNDDDNDDDQQVEEGNEQHQNDTSSETPSAAASANATTEGTVVANPLVLIPSLRGDLLMTGNSTVCKGKWAMSDAAHANPDHTSDFEIKLVKAADGALPYPASGKYQGWFTLKQMPPAKSIKIEDKEVHIKFQQNEDGSFQIVGEGQNKFGKFTLNGTLDHDGKVQMYREYVVRPIATKLKRPSTNGVNVTGVTSNSLADAATREGAGRVRKASTVLREKDASKPAKSPRPGKQSTTAAAAGVASSTTTAATISAVIKADSGRVQRLPPHILKCSELLKEISKHPNAIWFAEPVDYIKLNIPDYPAIIAEPIDFKTIRSNLDSGVYSSHEDFAEHVRLVFKNAQAYNQSRDNPVHMASKDLSARFEDKYRVMQASLQAQGKVLDDIPRSALTKKNPKQQGRPSLGGAPARGPSSMTQPTNRNRVSTGNHSMSHQSAMYMPPVIDPSAVNISDLFRRMEALENEVKLLRSEVSKGKITQSLEQRALESHNPLTLAEKQTLINKVYKLPPSKMEEVTVMIQTAMSLNNPEEDGEIEISLDELDTATLRKLQKLIEEYESSKKRPPQRSNPVMKSGETLAKKPKVEAPVHVPMHTSTSNTQASSSQVHNTNSNSIDNNMSMFGTQSFDQLREASTPNISNTHDDDDGDDDQVYI